MCGIVGYYSNHPARYEQKLWESARKHQFRGPDETTHYCHEGFSVVFNRLAIVSRHNGSQPLSNENGTVISFANAEIYNHQDLRTRYSAYFYQNDSDCAVIPTLYHCFGA